MDLIKKTNLKDFTFISWNGFKKYETNFFQKAFPNQRMRGIVLGVT